ncbi:transposase [Pyxidicoccus parkwayensis]|uniref:Transposase n=1 Tax=Pyxidicoccus parkwayensis TaxID=2813578 RepID=A0ABX7P2A7_9BACT|nr:transposase [Pyxidicoccus parkwaysis]
MELEKKLEQFRQEAQRLKAGRRSGSLPFPEALRAFAVRYAEHTVAAGRTVTDAAQKLGVSGPTLYEWRKGRPAGGPRPKPTTKSAALVPVRLSERPARAPVAGMPQVALGASAPSAAQAQRVEQVVLVARAVSPAPWSWDVERLASGIPLGTPKITVATEPLRRPTRARRGGGRRSRPSSVRVPFQSSRCSSKSRHVALEMEPAARHLDLRETVEGSSEQRRRHECQAEEHCLG